MIHFIIYEDILIYKTRIKKIIDNLMNYINYDIIETKKYKIKNNDLNIYIIDLDNKNSLELIQKIHENLTRNYYIIYFTNRLEMKYLLMQKYHYVPSIIYKYDNYEKTLKINIIKVITDYKEKNNLYYNLKNNIKIPKTEIKELIILDNKIILKGKTKCKQDYTYIIDGNFSNIKNQITNNFSLENENHIIFNNDKIFNLQLNLNITKRKLYTKPYSKEIKENIIFLYKMGFKVKLLSELFVIPSRTIYNWIKNDLYNSLIKKAQKYDKIVDITKE